MKDPEFAPVLKRVEIISGFVLGMGLVFKYALQWPFASPMLVVGIGSLAVVYAVGGGVLLKSDTLENENKLLINATGILLAVGLIGVLFKLMFWPNAMNMLIVASVVLPFAIGVAIWLKNNQNNSEEGTYRKLLVRSVIVYTVVVALYFTPISTIIAFQHRGDDEMIRLKTQSYEHPENEEYRRQLNDYWNLKNPNNHNKK